MGVELRIHLADRSQTGALGAWLAGVPDVVVTPVASPARPGQQGDVWEFLTVLCGTGGAVTVAVNAVTTWIESKRIHARVTVGETEVEVSGSDPEALARLVETVKRAAIDQG